MRFLGWLMFVVGALIFVVGISILASDVVVGLKVGSWEPVGINILWGGEELQTERAGLTRISDVVGGFPIGLLVALAGVTVGNLGETPLIDRTKTIDAPPGRARKDQ